MLFVAGLPLVSSPLDEDEELDRLLELYDRDFVLRLLLTGDLESECVLSRRLLLDRDLDLDLKRVLHDLERFLDRCSTLDLDRLRLRELDR